MLSNPDVIMQKRIAKELGLAQYANIMQSVRSTDISADPKFQTLFNGYYRIRRNAAWQKEFYTLFEAVKKETPTFSDIVSALHQKTNAIEASFASKMLATLNPLCPIWDRNVLACLGLHVTGTGTEERLAGTFHTYAAIEDWYCGFLNTENAQECFKIFDRTLPDYVWISPVKKIDFFLWSSGQENTAVSP